MRAAFMICAALAAPFIAGCSTTGGLGSADYSSRSARGAGSVEACRVIQMRDVRISPEQGISKGAGYGAILGGLAGGVLDKNHYGGAALGGTLGGIVGQEVATATVPGEELIVLTDQGQRVIVSQSVDPAHQLEVGSPCWLVRDNEAVRVINRN